MPYPPYVPTDWIDLTTLVDEARMDKMETGIKNATDAVIDLDARLGAGDAASIESSATGDVTATNVQAAIAELAAEKQATSQKGQANGYASLDAGAKVPAAQLPGGSGVDYIGDWGSGITYKKGDVVRYGGNDYMAVNDSTGVTPPAVSIPGIVGVGTSLPAVPFDGQEYILVDSLTAPTYQWRFRYVASITDAYKWVFLGGAPLTVRASASATVTSDALADFSVVMSLLTPRAGDYIVEGSIGGMAFTNGLLAYWSLFAGGAEEFAVNTFGVAGGNWQSGGASGRRFNGVAAGAVIKQRGGATTAPTLTVRDRFLSLTPVRVA